MNSVIDHQRDEEDFPNMQRDPIRWALEKMGRTIEELRILCARPIPFFIPGGIVHGGPTIVGEEGMEVVKEVLPPMRMNMNIDTKLNLPDQA